MILIEYDVIFINDEKQSVLWNKKKKIGEKKIMHGPSFRVLGHSSAQAPDWLENHRVYAQPFSCGSCDLYFVSLPQR